MSKIINGVASEYDMPMKYENKTMTIEVKNDEMLGRITDSTLHIELIKLQQENKQLKEVIEEVREHIEKNLSFCENDSQSAYDVCNIRIASDRKLLQILEKAKGE